MTTKFQIDILNAMPVNTKETQFLYTQKKNRMADWNSKEGSLILHSTNLKKHTLILIKGRESGWVPIFTSSIAFLL